MVLNQETLSKRTYNFFFLPHCRSLDFKPLLEKAKPMLVDSSLDKPKALIRNEGYQPIANCVPIPEGVHHTFSSFNHINKQKSNILGEGQPCVS